MSYSAFGKFKNLALRLIHDDFPLSKRFFSGKHSYLLGELETSLCDAAVLVNLACEANVPLIIPCTAVLASGSSTDTHAVALVTDGESVHFFDPNGMYDCRGPKYFVRGEIIRRDRILRFLQRYADSRASWTQSLVGIQSTIREHKNTRYVPKNGYCMLLCRLLIERLLDSHPRDFLENIVKFEKLQCKSKSMGKLFCVKLATVFHKA